MKKLLQNERFIGALLSAIAFVVYFLTLAPGVGPYDAGELSTAISTLGIAHPSGYPLFTLLGWIFIHLPLGGSTIWKLNLFSALCSAIAVFFFYRFFLLLLRLNLAAPPARGAAKNRRKEPKTDGSLDLLAAASSALVLAFSRTYWEQALNIEVYALHLLLLSLTLWLFLRGVGKQASTRAWLGFAFALGLGFTNHLTMVLLAPAFLVLFFSIHGFSRAAWIRILQAVPPFLLPLSLYLYLPLRAAQHPWSNWGDVSTFKNFWWHVTTHAYQHEMFSSAEVFSRQSDRFFSRLAPAFGYLPLLAAIAGLTGLWFRNRRLWLFAALLFAGCLGFSLFYNFHDTDSFFLLADVAVAVWMLFGLHIALNGLARYPSLAIPGRALCAGLCLFPLLLNFNAVDESKDHVAEDYVRNVLNALPPNALLLSNQGGLLVTPALYLQKVEGLRPDVTLLDYTQLGAAAYYRELETRRPWLVRNSRTEIDAMVDICNKLENQSQASLEDTLLFSQRLVDVVQSFFHENADLHPGYVTAEIFPDFTKGWLRIPEGLVQRLTLEPPVHPSSLPEITFRPIPAAFPLEEQIKMTYAAGFADQGAYSLFARHDTAAAKALLRRSLQLNPEYIPAIRWLQRLGKLIEAPEYLCQFMLTDLHLQKYLQGRLSPEEEDELRQLIEKSPDLKKRLEELEDHPTLIGRPVWERMQLGRRKRHGSRIRYTTLLPALLILIMVLMLASHWFEKPGTNSTFIRAGGNGTSVELLYNSKNGWRYIDAGFRMGDSLTLLIRDQGQYAVKVFGIYSGIPDPVAEQIWQSPEGRRFATSDVEPVFISGKSESAAPKFLAVIYDTASLKALSAEEVPGLLRDGGKDRNAAFQYQVFRVPDSGLR